MGSTRANISYLDGSGGGQGPGLGGTGQGESTQGGPGQGGPGQGGPGQGGSGQGGSGQGHHVTSSLQLIKIKPGIFILTISNMPLRFLCATVKGNYLEDTDLIDLPQLQ